MSIFSKSLTCHAAYHFLIIYTSFSYSRSHWHIIHGIYWLTLVIAHDHSYYVFLIDILYYFMIHYFVLTSPIYYILYLNLCAIYFIYHLLLIINGTIIYYHEPPILYHSFIIFYLYWWFMCLLLSLNLLYAINLYIKDGE